MHSRALSPSDIHLWTVGIGEGQPPDVLRARAALLTPDEAQRADRFLRPADRDRFVLARAALREILAQYVGRSPSALVLGTGPHGKPMLIAGDGAGDGGASERLPEFNVSHSGDIAVVALTADQAVGVDLEQIRSMPDADRMAARFFSVNEYAQYCTINPESRLDAFFRCWTRKEAYIKARGEGLSLSLQSFDVTLTPSERPRVLRIDDGTDEAAFWSLREFEPAAGYVGAVAARMRDVTLSSFVF